MSKQSELADGDWGSAGRPSALVRSKCRTMGEGSACRLAAGWTFERDAHRLAMRQRSVGLLPRSTDISNPPAVCSHPCVSGATGAGAKRRPREHVDGVRTSARSADLPDRVSSRDLPSDDRPKAEHAISGSEEEWRVRRRPGEVDNHRE